MSARDDEPAERRRRLIELYRETGYETYAPAVLEPKRGAVLKDRADLMIAYYERRALAREQPARQRSLREKLDQLDEAARLAAVLYDDLRSHMAPSDPRLRERLDEGFWREPALYENILLFSPAAARRALRARGRSRIDDSAALLVIALAVERGKVASAHKAIVRWAAAMAREHERGMTVGRLRNKWSKQGRLLRDIARAVIVKWPAAAEWLAISDLEVGGPAKEKPALHGPAS